MLCSLRFFLSHNIKWNLFNQYIQLNYKTIQSTIDSQTSKHHQLIHLAIVSCNGRTDETITLIKSALVFSNCSNLQFHIFVDNRSYSNVNEAVSLISEL